MSDFYFPHELAGATVKFIIDPNAAPDPETGTNALTYTHGVATGEAWQTSPLEIEGTEGTLSLDALSAAVLAEELTIAESPFLIKGPKPPEGPPPPPPPKPHQNLSAKAKLGINFGKDKLTIVVALNGGGGAAASGGGGAGYIASGAGGQGVSVTGNIKGYSINPVFEVGPLLKSDESIIIALRCMLRYFYHWCDALNLAIDYLKNKLPKAKSEQDFMSEFLGFNWWMFVFSLFAMKDMLFDIMADEADFIADILQKIGIEAKFDASAAGNFDVEVGADVNGVVSGKAYVPLAVMLAPIIEFMMAGSTAPKPKGGSLADKIVPYIEGVVEERVSVAVGAMPAAFLVEAKGILARCTFAVPKGSPLRGKIEKVGEEMAKAADHYKNNRLKTIPDETKILRLIIDLLDHEVRSMVKMVRAAQKVKAGDTSGAKDGADALSAGVEAATPYVKQIMDALAGKHTEEPPGISPNADAALRMLKSGKVQGVAVGIEGPLEITDSGERKQLVLHVTDQEKPKVSAGFSPKSIEARLETSTIVIPLPAKPAAVGWNYVSQNPRLANDYAGIIAGFDDLGGRDTCKRACLQNGWVPQELGAFEDQHPNDSEGLHWAWVAVGLSTYLASRQPPLLMPELELTDDGKLRLVFDELPIGIITDQIKSDVPLFRGATITRETIWKVVLMDDATGEEADAIRDQVDDNQPSDDPYETVLDDLLDGASSGGGTASAPANPEEPKRFSQLGRRFSMKKGAAPPKKK